MAEVSIIYEQRTQTERSTQAEGPTQAERPTQPIDRRHFRRRNIIYPKVVHKTRLSKNRINNIAQECINALEDTNDYVDPEKVKAILLQVLRVPKLQDLKIENCTYIYQLKCVGDLCRHISRVTDYVHAFVKVRSISTLHELKCCLAEYAPDQEDIASCQFGPLQRLPVVKQLFQFPDCMAEIPVITSIDVLDHLAEYMTKYDLWLKRVDLNHFMQYLAGIYEAEDAVELGIKIRSMPLAVEVLKKAQRDQAETRKDMFERMKTELRSNIEKCFGKFSKSLMEKSDDSFSDIQSHYLTLKPEEAITEIFEKFKVIVTVDESDSNASDQYVMRVNDFLEEIRKDEMSAELFHLAICISDTNLDQYNGRQLTGGVTQNNEKSTEDDGKILPRKDEVLDRLKKYLRNRDMTQGTLKLADLDAIEQSLNRDFGFTSFSDMGLGNFLNFVISQAKTMIEQLGGVGIIVGAMEEYFLFKPQEIEYFLLQCKQCEIKLKSDQEEALKRQFRIKDVKQLGHGSIDHIYALAEMSGKHQSNIFYETALYGSNRVSFRGQSSILREQTLEAALVCLHNCPLLEDMADWSQWTLVFEPQFGDLKDFIQKYGGIRTLLIEEENKVTTTDIVALETRPHVLLKLISNADPETFEAALAKEEVVQTCGILVSMVVEYKGINHMPLELLSNKVKSVFFPCLHLTLEISVKMQPATQAAGTLVDVFCSLLERRDERGRTGDEVVDKPESQDCTCAVLCRTHVPSFVPSCAIPMCSPLCRPLCRLALSSAVPSTAPTPRNVSRKRMKESTSAVESQRQESVLKFVLECLMKLPFLSCLSIAYKVFLEPLGHILGSSKSKMRLWKSCKTIKEKNRLQELGCLLGISEWIQIFERCTLPPDATKTNRLEEANDLLCLNVINFDEDKETNNNSNVATEESQSEETGVNKRSITRDSACREEQNDEFSNGSGMTEEERTERCNSTIQNIRRDEFGIGVDLNEDGERLMKIHQERLGRSLDRLSKDLYSKDTHFVLELIQNADDNSYPDFIDENAYPSCEFIMRNDAVILLNNERGFEEINIKALCDVGKSTKGKHKPGFIGQKGIGFKAVFRITDRPEVHSNGYHICFDAKSGPIGYILPHWIADTWEEGKSWTTKIVLPLKQESQTLSLSARFSEINPSLLLFLHRLRQITINNKVEHYQKHMRRRDLGNRVIEIEHSDGVERFLVVKKSLDVSSMSSQAKSGVEVDSTEIALAFPLSPKNATVQVLPQKQRVFAFLPLRSYGFRFIVQGDFDVPSSREEVSRDSPWNQWIRNEIHTLFIDALEYFKTHEDFETLETAVTAFLKFVPMPDEILDFFHPVASQILTKLQAKQIIPTEPDKMGHKSCRIPSEIVTVNDPLIREVVTPEVLQKHLNLFYIHREVAQALGTTLIQCLGIKRLTTEHLIQIGKSMTVDKEKKEVMFEEQVLQTAKWLACVYRSLDEFSDNRGVIDTLRTMKIIPLSTNQFVSVEEMTVFFPLSENSEQLMGLEAELNTIHPRLITTPDSEINSQIKKLLQEMKVYQWLPEHVVENHIIPILKSEEWKNKDSKILVSYIVYIKEMREEQNIRVDLKELSSIVQLVTNHGIKNPKNDIIHFSCEYQKKLDLQEKFPGYRWTFISSDYLSNSRSQSDKQRWFDFLSELGVELLPCVRSEKVDISNASMKNGPWSDRSDSIQTLQDGCYMQNYTSTEIEDIIKNNRNPATYRQQMKNLFELLDCHWDNRYSKFRYCQFFTTENKLLREKNLDSSFSTLLQASDWLPTTKVQYDIDSLGNVKKIITDEICQPSCIHVRTAEIESLMSYTVMYLEASSYQQNTFGEFLGLNTSVTCEEIKNSLIKWGKRKIPGTPTKFFTSLQHINSVYRFLHDQLPTKQAQNLFRCSPIIFVPACSFPETPNTTDIIDGEFFYGTEVWWDDDTGLFVKYRGLLEEDDNDLCKMKIISPSYEEKEIRNFLMDKEKIRLSPSAVEYGQLLVCLSNRRILTNLPLTDILLLYEMIGTCLQNIPSSEDAECNRNVLDAQETKLMSCFKGRKVFATKRQKWVSMEEKPLIADNRDLEIVFSKKGIHFLDLQENTKVRNSSLGKQGDRKINLEAVHFFFTICGIRKLSKVCQREIVTEMSENCPKLQDYLYRAVPLIQRFLFSKYEEVYKRHQQEKTKELLQQIRIVQVKKLELRYTLEDHPDIFHIVSEKCLRDGLLFCFHEKHLNKFNDINTEVAKYFSLGDEHCTGALSLFLNNLKPTLTGRTEKSQQELMDELDELPNEEELWSIPHQTVLAEVLEPFREETDESDTEDNTVRTSRRVMAWPPMSNASSCNKQLRNEENDTKHSGRYYPLPLASKTSKIDKMPKSASDAGSDKQQNIGRSAGNSVTSKFFDERTEKSHKEKLRIRETYSDQPEALSQTHKTPHKTKILKSTADTESDDQENKGASSPRKSQTSYKSDGKPWSAKKSTKENPAWTDTSSDTVFEELGNGSNLVIPQNIELAESQDADQIGKWGEELVFLYLKKSQEQNHNIKNIVWENDQSESGKPYDFKIQYLTETGLIEEYIEVKSTCSDRKEVMEISSQQLKFAHQQEERFHIYRVFNAGKPSKVKLVRINNISLRLDKKEVRICLLI